MQEVPNIASERVRLGMTQEELAEKIGVSESTLRAWEKGEREPNVSSLRFLSGVFGCSSDYLLGLTDERRPH